MQGINLQVIVSRTTTGKLRADWEATWKRFAEQVKAAEAKGEMRPSEAAMTLSNKAQYIKNWKKQFHKQKKG